MSNITKVALAEDTGTLGSFLLDQLVIADFRVTILTRERSARRISRQIRYRSVDYDSLSSLSNALEGQDALISPLELFHLPTQLLLIEAAAKSHVKRYIPGVFRANTLNENVRKLPTFGIQVDVHNALEKEAASCRMTYSVICTGPILDSEIKNSTIMNLECKAINLFDGGNRVFSTTTLPTIGKAVIGVLTHLEETKNRVLYVQDTAMTLQSLAAMGEKATGADGWIKNVVSVDETLEQALEELKAREQGFGLLFYQAACFGEGHGSHFEKIDNELLGLGQMSDAQVEGLIRSLATWISDVSALCSARSRSVESFGSRTRSLS